MAALALPPELAKRMLRLVPKPSVVEASAPRSQRRTLLELIRFGSVGGSTAVLYFVLVWILAKLLPSLPMWVIAALASGPPLLAGYLLHRSFTFNSQAQHKNSGPRFLMVHLGATVINSLVIWLGTDLGHLPFVPVQLGAIGVQVIFTYLSQKHFVFS